MGENFLEVGAMLRPVGVYHVCVFLQLMVCREFFMDTMQMVVYVFPCALGVLAL